MQANITYKENAKYFQPISIKPGAIAIVIGLLVLMGGAGSGGATFVGLIIAAIGAALIYFQTQGRSTDQDIDNQAAAAMSSLVQESLAKLGLDPEEVKLIEPLQVSGNYWKSLGDSSLRAKKGKDGFVRTNNIEGVVLLFGEHQVHYFKKQLSLTDPGSPRTLTDEYFYRDIVSIQTMSESERVSVVDGAPLNVNTELLKLTTSGGTSVTSSIRDLTPQTEQSIQAARALIRSKKMN